VRLNVVPQKRIMSAKIKIAESDTEIQSCFSVMSQLRPHLSADSFVTVVRSQMNDGYLLAYLEDLGVVQSVTGFRFMTVLSAGYHMHVDDLVSDTDNRSKGYGSQLFDWLVDLAKSKGCKKLRLDSGVQRFGAHRFYLRKGMDITCHHFDLIF
jgi:GNAT superfamily N-acetyltransferase